MSLARAYLATRVFDNRRYDKLLTVWLAGFSVAEIALLAAAAESDLVIDAGRFAMASGSAGPATGRLMRGHSI